MMRLDLTPKKHSMLTPTGKLVLLIVGFLAAVVYAIGCDQPARVQSLHRAVVTCDVYCAKKHTAAEAQLLGLAGNSGCTSVAAPDKPLASSMFPDGKICPTDEAAGFLCENCAAIEAAIADQPKAVAPLAPVVTVRMVGQDLWAADDDRNAWKLVLGAMVAQPALPDGWPMK